jgi:hypothetical protein
LRRQGSHRAASGRSRCDARRRSSDTRRRTFARGVRPARPPQARRCFTWTIFASPSAQESSCRASTR